MQDLVMDSFNQAGTDVRASTWSGCFDQTKVFLAEKGMSSARRPISQPFRQKLKDAGLYKEWKEKMGPAALGAPGGDQRPAGRISGGPPTMVCAICRARPSWLRLATMARAIERPLMWRLEFCAAALVAADIAILFGVSPLRFRSR